MSLPIMHTAVGMTFPFIIGVIRFLKKRKITSKFLITITFFMVLCGFIAEIPDMPRFLPLEYQHLQKDLTDSWYSNLFFFHGALDRHRPEEGGTIEGGLAIFSMFFLLLFASSISVLVNDSKIKRIEKTLNDPSSVKASSVSFKDIVDIHCHILPGIDDGPGTIDESIAMCRMLVENGIKQSVTTPHLPWEGSYDTAKIKEAYNILVKKIEDEKIPLKLSLGADIHIDFDLVDRLKRGELITVAGSRYFLLELDDNTVPMSLENFILRCDAEGFYPILTHPERNVIFQSDYGMLKTLSKLPMLIQITACCLANDTNNKERKLAMELLKDNAVDILASDAHSSTFRLKRFQKGLNIAKDLVGEDKVNTMVSKIPSMVVNNNALNDVKIS